MVLEGLVMTAAFIIIEDTTRYIFEVACVVIGNLIIMADMEYLSFAVKCYISSGDDVSLKYRYMASFLIYGVGYPWILWVY